MAQALGGSDPDTPAPEAAVDTWSGTDVSVGEIVRALTDLRHRSARSATRTAVMTLVVVATNSAEADLATRTTHALQGHHPARIVLLRPHSELPRGLDASASIVSSTADGQAVVFEEVTVDVKGPATAHMDTIVEPLTLADLPVVVWYPGALPDPSDALLAVAAAVLVDTKEAGVDRTFATLDELARRRTVVDLSWTRLRPWRELLAALFDDPALRPFVSGVQSAQVAGKPGPRALLGGWLSTQLGLRVEQVTLRDARHVQMTLRAELDGATGTFHVGRLDDTRSVWAGATTTGQPSRRQVLPLPEGSLAWSLGQALTHLEADRVWQRALVAAGALAAVGPTA